MTATRRSLVLLQSGDRLTRAEFHRRYCLLPDVRAELIDGVVYVASPERAGVHGTPQSLASWWLNGYAALVPGLQIAVNATVFLTDNGEPQPDACLYWDPWTGRGARLNSDDYLEGAPELAVEISASSVSYDLHDKKAMYQRAGVREYLVWRVLDGQFDWFRLVDGVYVLVAPDAEGLIESAVFPGLRLDTAAMLRGDRPAILAALTLPPLSMS